MQRLSLYAIGIASIALAVILWLAVGYGAFLVSGRIDALRMKTEEVRDVAAESGAALRVRALLRETALERSVLSTSLSADPLVVVGAVEKIGPASHTVLSVESATALLDVGSKANPVHSVSLVVRIEGSFEHVVNALALLESLPYAAVMDGFEMERGASKEGLWYATSHVRIFTTAPLPV